MTTPSVEPARRGHVLVVDDDPMVLKTIVRTLSRDHEVVAAAGGAAALEAIAAHACFDVILCDLMMPSMTGAELYQRLSLIPDQVERVIFMTGGVLSPETQTFLDAIPNVWVEKPYDTKALRALVNNRVR